MRASALSAMAAATLTMIPALGAGTVPATAAPSTSQTIYVDASAPSSVGNGSAQAPFRSLGDAVEAAKDGDTIQMASGTYREGDITVSKAVTITAAPGAKPVLSGALDPGTWTPNSDGTWSTPSNMVRFCDKCTTNNDPAVEGVAAYPEQVFVDGKPLRQVLSRAEVTADTFYVEDADPISLRQAGNRSAGYHTKDHRGARYVIGASPSAHEIEVVQYSRALSLLASGSKLNGITVEKYAPVQSWDYRDPETQFNTGAAMVFVQGDNMTVTNSTFRYSSAGAGLFLASTTSSTVSGNTVSNNGGTGLGVNQSSGIAVERNYFSNNNTEGFNTTTCDPYCGIADMKVTHSQYIRYAYNTVDYSASSTDHADTESWNRNRASGIWFDEGVMDSQIVGSRFVNVPVGIFDELSTRTVIASNEVLGGGVGIQVAGSSDDEIWNNSVSHARTSLNLYEDKRSFGCNHRSSSGGCLSADEWSVRNGLSWDLTNARIYNNIFSSEYQSNEADDAAMVNVLGAEDQDGSSALYANDEVSGIDHNVYYRQSSSGPSYTILWHFGPDLSYQVLKAASLQEFTASEHVKTAGREGNGLDLSGERGSNPAVVSEPADPTAWQQYDLRARDGGPADGTGISLPEPVAKAIDWNTSGPVSRGVLVTAERDQGSTKPPAPQAPATTAAPKPQQSPAQPDGSTKSPAPQAPATTAAPKPQQSPAQPDGSTKSPAPQAPATTAAPKPQQSPAQPDGSTKSPAPQAPATTAAPKPQQSPAQPDGSTKSPAPQAPATTAAPKPQQSPAQPDGSTKSPAPQAPATTPPAAAGSRPDSTGQTPLPKKKAGSSSRHTFWKTAENKPPLAQDVPVDRTQIGAPGTRTGSTGADQSTAAAARKTRGLSSTGTTAVPLGLLALALTGTGFLVIAYRRRKAARA